MRERCLRLRVHKRLFPNGPQVTLTSNTDWKAQAAIYFNLHAKDGASYLVETDPLFTNKQQWLGSDYFLKQLNLDPERTLKRYGDGFAEQRAITDQLVNITGRNTLSVIKIPNKLTKP